MQFPFPFYIDLKIEKKQGVFEFGWVLAVYLGRSHSPLLYSADAGDSLVQGLAIMWTAPAPPVDGFFFLELVPHFPGISEEMLIFSSLSSSSRDK